MSDYYCAVCKQPSGMYGHSRCLEEKMLGENMDYCSKCLTQYSTEYFHVCKETKMEDPKPSANDRQPGGDHYRNKAIQPWDFIVSNNIPFLEGNVIKYLCRWREKNGMKDLEKAQHYLEKLIEVERAKVGR